MKVQLEAFQGTLRSDVMDWPEETAPTIRLAIAMDRLKVGPKGFYEDGMIPDTPIHKIGTFEDTGRSWFSKDGSVRVYKLTDIS